MLLTHLSQPIEHARLSLLLDQSRAKPREQRNVTTRIAHFPSQRVFPIQTFSDGTGCQPIREILAVLQHRDQGQPPRSRRRMLFHRGEIEEVFIGLRDPRPVLRWRKGTFCSSTREFYPEEGL